MRNRIKFSQNFIKDINLVNKLVNLTSINKNDTVLEIGSGNGIITSVLSERSGNVIAYEIDKNYYNDLIKKFASISNVKIENNDFTNTTLPGYSYKVFSNIPFNITANILKKLLFDNNPPSDIYLILQREAALKYLGKPFDNKNSLQSILTYPWFEKSVIYEFENTDFFPPPNTEIVLIHFQKRKDYLIDQKEKNDFFDFVTHIYSQYKPELPGNATQSELDFAAWVKMFEKYHGEFKGAYAKLLGQQKSLQKINRTRLDKDWKHFRNN